MISPKLVRAAQWMLLGAMLLAPTALRDPPAPVVNQAIIWLPTGVAIAGVWLLGMRAAWLVALATLILRFLLGYQWYIAIPGAMGSTAEAMLGVFVLRRLGFDLRFARLRDVAALLAAAAIAPLGSILISWLGRSLIWMDAGRTLLSGWDGWWRMNALGALTVVPVALTWLTIPLRELTTRLVMGVLIALVAIPAVLLTALVLVPPGTTGVIWLYFVMVPIVLFAAARFGVRGATLACTLSALVVAMAATYGLGPFIGLPGDQQPMAIQLFELTFVAIPPAFGALLAERQVAQDRGAISDRLRRSMESALPDITYRIRRDGVCLGVSVPPGMSPPVPIDALLGRSIFDVVAPELAGKFRALIEDAFHQKTPSLLEYELTIEGRSSIREARCVPHGETEVLAVVRDITDRKWSEGTMVFEARVLELVAAGQPTPQIFAAIVTGIESLTPGGKCSIIVLDGRRMHIAMAPSLAGAYNDAIEGLEIGPTVGSCGSAAATNQTVVVRDIANDPLWTPYRELALAHGLRACWSVPFRDSNGAVLGTFAEYYGQIREPEPRELALTERAAALVGIVLEREQRGDALRRSEELLASINRNVKEGLFRAGPDLRVVYSNLALAHLFGHAAPADILGCSLRESFADPARLEEILQVAGENGQWLSEEAEIIRHDGTRIWVQWSGTAVRNADGEVEHFDGAFADITARKELEMQFRQAQKMEAVGKLAGGVAHDFNNLLTVIFGYADAIRTESGGQPQIRSHADRVLDAAGRASRLTRQLLAYSRQQVLSPRVVELTAVVDQMSGMLRRLIGEDLRLVVRHESGPCWVKVDTSQIEQVLLNLVVNARDASPSGATLTITSARMDTGDPRARAWAELPADPCVILSVRDTGVGMSAEVQGRAFDPFFTTKGPGEGTGLGLSTVYGIVKQSGGAVWLDSTPAGGTTVWISLPLSAAPALPLEEPVARGSGPREGTVLVVEDEAGVRNLVSMTLRREGYRVLEAPDGAVALEVARSHEGTIDVVVTDVVMPVLGGREMASRLVLMRPGQRFLFISGYPDDARLTQEVVGDKGAFLAKPFTPDQLAECVHAILQAAPRP